MWVKEDPVVRRLILFTGEQAGVILTVVQTGLALFHL